MIKLQTAKAEWTTLLLHLILLTCRGSNSANGNMCTCRSLETECRGFQTL